MRYDDLRLILGAELKRYSRLSYYRVLYVESLSDKKGFVVFHQTRGGSGKNVI